jgi:integrase
VALTIKRVARYLNTTGRYSDGGGLYLQVPAPGEKMPRESRGSWLLRYERDGKEHWFGLGAVKDFDLDEARELARQARRQLKQGIDPLEAERAKRAQQALDAAKAMTFEEAAVQYFNQHERKWKNARHRQQFMNTLVSYAFPKVGRLAVSALDTGQVLRVLEQKHEDYPDVRLWEAVPETANRLRGRIESILDWATVRGYRTGDNPARWKGHLSEVLPAKGAIAKVNHHAALPYAELPAFLPALREREGVAPLALEFCILTAARTGEVTGVQWAEIDLKEKIWTIPANRIKGGKEHRVPLSDRALEILRTVPREDGNDFVFIGNRKGMALSDMAMAVLLKRMGRNDITVHGFRSTFRVWADERTGYPNHVVEQALAHTVGNAVERAYRRTDLFDKRRKLMAEWCKYCCSPPTKATGDVVPLRGKR